jgi:hypothetical protein
MTRCSPAPRLGVHLPLGDFGCRGRDRREIGATTIQVFVDNPTAWKRRITPPEKPRRSGRLEELDIRPSGGPRPYLVNPAGADSSFRAASIAVLASDLAAAGGYGAWIVNASLVAPRHLGRGRDQLMPMVSPRLQAASDFPAPSSTEPGSRSGAAAAARRSA